MLRRRTRLMNLASPYPLRLGASVVNVGFQQYVITIVPQLVWKMHRQLQVRARSNIAELDCSHGAMLSGSKSQQAVPSREPDRVSPSKAVSVRIAETRRFEERSVRNPKHRQVQFAHPEECQ